MPETGARSGFGSLDDASLLRIYAERQTQDAFAEFVQRHIDLVHSTALRCAMGHTHLAEDVTQEVFIAVARRAAALATHPALEGWLYTTARYEARRVGRREERRRIREQNLYIMNELDRDSAAEPAWQQIRPFLDEAMDQLTAADREAIVMRFFLRRSFREIGAKLQLTDDTARRRVDRALIKLHRLLTRRGIAFPAAAVAGILSSQAVVAAPAGLAASVTAAAVGASVGTASLTFTLLHFMNTSKIVAGTVVGLIVAASWTAWHEANACGQLANELTITDRQSASLQRQLTDLETRAQSIEGERTELTAAIAAARVTVPAFPPAKPMPLPPVRRATQNKSPEMIAGDKFLADHPEARQLWDAREKAALSTKMAPFYRSLRLSSEQVAAWEELVLQNQTRNTGVNSPDGLLMLHAEAQLTPEEFEARARVLLGDAGWEQAKEFARLAPAYDLTSKLAGAVYRRDPLSSNQIDGLAQILANASASFREGRAADRATIDWSTAIDQAHGILTAGQLAALANLERQTEYQQAALNLTAPQR